MYKLDLQLFATNAMSTKLQIGATAIAELHDIGGMNLTADHIETTTLDSASNFRTFIQKLKDGGDITASGFFNPGDAGQAALYAAFGTGAVTAFTILFPSTLGASWTFNAIVVEVKTGAKVGDAIPWDVKLKVTGVPSLLVTASADLTALALTGTGGTLTPAYASGTYSYSYSFTGAGLTITPTQVGANINLYVDGVLTQSGISSGAPSANIPFAAIGSKKLTLLVNDPGKTIKTYDIVGIRTA